MWCFGVTFGSKTSSSSSFLQPLADMLRSSMYWEAQMVKIEAERAKVRSKLMKMNAWNNNTQAFPIQTSRQHYIKCGYFCRQICIWQNTCKYLFQQHNTVHNIWSTTEQTDLQCQLPQCVRAGTTGGTKRSTGSARRREAWPALSLARLLLGLHEAPLGRTGGSSTPVLVVRQNKAPHRQELGLMSGDVAFGQAKEDNMSNTICREDK